MDSAQLSATIKGGKQFFNDKAIKAERVLKTCIVELHDHLTNTYPDMTFYHKSRVYKTEIAQKLGVTGYVPESKSFISPDGGILGCIIDGREFPIIISEAKKQGTNDRLQAEGKKKQAKGNAIERSFKNIEEVKLFCSDLDYFPYVMFVCGCDFEKGSSILDRLDAATKYHPRNTDYTLSDGQLVTLYVQPEDFIYNDMLTHLLGISTKVIEYINQNY